MTEGGLWSEAGRRLRNNRAAVIAGGLLVLLVLAWAGLHGILTSCTRFRLPIDPILFLLAATAIVRILGPRRPRAM